MNLFFKVPDKELLAVRNKIFTEVGIPALEKNGFIKAPFSTSWFGRNNMGDYTYELARLSCDSHLEFIVTHITRGDHWIKIFLNVFQLSPKIDSIEQLKDIDGLNFYLPPTSLTKMRLRSDDYKGPPLFYKLFCPEHKIGKSCHKNGFDRKIQKLKKLINEDMVNIDAFVKRWYELHQPSQTDWTGNKLS